MPKSMTSDELSEILSYQYLREITHSNQEIYNIYLNSHPCAFVNIC